jgi:hypothetical protein
MAGCEGPDGTVEVWLTLSLTSALEVCVVSTTSGLLYLRKRNPVPIVQEAGWFPGPFRRNAKNLPPTGIRSSDLPAHSE